MKKSIIVMSLLALALSATTAFAKVQGKGPGGFIHQGQGDLADSQFVLFGSIHSKGSNSLSVDVNGSVHVPDISNGQAIVAVDSDTKIEKDKDPNATFGDLAVSDNVVIQGTVSGSSLTAKHIHVLNKEHKGKNHKKFFGEVTAKTSDSITVKNNLTGVSKTFTTDDNTKVAINGEVKTISDIEVGDRGWVKFKTVVSDLVAKMISLFR